jgi:hypothetical protein
MNMKTEDPFEQRLHCQTLRQVPSEWRADILAAAAASRLETTKQPTAAGEIELIEWWRLWFARLPMAWSALAAIWIALIGVNLTLPAPFVSISALVSPSAREESLTAMNFPTLELNSVPVQISPPPNVAPGTKPPANPSRPRSERRRDLDYCCIASSHTTFRQIA